MSWKIGHPIKRDGTNQQQRLPDALRPEYNPVDDRRAEDLIFFIYRLADQFVYYNENNVAEMEDDDGWKTFFTALQDRNGAVTPASIRQYLARTEQRADNSVFMTILLAFLKMFGYVQQDLNTLTQKHLDFYYGQVLGFRRLPPTPDEVHVFFELAPLVRRHYIPAGTALKAGNDNLGKPLTYVTNREIVVNKARLDSIKTSLVTPDGNIYAAKIANSADGRGAPLEGTAPKWPIFGHPDHMQTSTAGFAIASPLLLLKEGMRKVRLLFTFTSIPDKLVEKDFSRFIAYGSGAEDWIELALQLEGPIDRDQKKVTFLATAYPNQPAIVAYNPALEGRFDTGFPVIRLSLRQNQPLPEAFKALVISELALSVEVIADENQAGVQDLILQNDTGILDAGSAFQPFGDLPVKGSRFYIGSREVFSKPLDKLTIQLQWAGLPDNEDGFSGYYNLYPENYKSIYRFTGSFQVLKDGKWSDVLMSKRLFSSESDGSLSQVQIMTLDHPILNNLHQIAGMPEFEALQSALNQGFIRMTLAQDFGHREYSKIFAQIAAKPPADKTFPNPPYTPQVQSVSLGYTASQTITPGLGRNKAQFFHLQPFGSSEQTLNTPVNLFPTLPRAALYLGLADFEPPQNLHLLFQVAEGSALPGEVIRREDIEWNYLTKNGWRERPLSGSEILADTTQGLQKSGIIAFNIGSDAAKETTFLPHGLHWIRATIQKNPAGATQAVAIHPQAVTAVFQDNGNDPAHLLAPLFAGAITGLTERDSAVRKVQQPYASFGGAPDEPDGYFYTRVSERLRHKGRAVTLWDMEHLVLQRFPELYEVKALPHTGIDESKQYSEFQPGQTTVVVIPKLLNQNAVNPLQPAVSVALQEEVRRYLLPLTTSFLGHTQNALHVINPRYEPIRLSFSVAFRAGFDRGFYAEVLQAALLRRLSPWAFEAGVDIRFGGRLYKSQLLAFVEEQPYVDYVTDFKMQHANTGPGIGEMSISIDFFVRGSAFGEDVDIAEASTAASILVSEDKHRINILNDQFPCTDPNLCSDGIGCWFIDIDFLVS